MPSPVDLTSDPDFINCAFCRRISVGHFLFEDDSVIVFRDAFPVSPGHLHILPRRHEANFLDLSYFERDALWDSLETVRDWLGKEHSPDGLNIGINIGQAAGQSVPHANIHVIPRYGKPGREKSGIRWVLGGQGAEYKNRKRNCGFCQQIKDGDTLVEGRQAVGIKDAYPITPGHCHALPRRHAENIFDLSVEERDELWEMLDLLVAEIEAGPEKPDGYNIGINVGQAAGQSTSHANVHLVPRRLGDVDAEGGVRWVQRGESADYRSGRQ